ncbi:MAG: aminomethyl-transferring glycine dehydrogenase subunit GcvPA [Planctomycetaceae bacterium]
MAYLFDTPEQREKMLAAIGVASIDELFRQIPETLQLKRELDLPEPLSELALQQQMEQLLTPSVRTPVCFLGGGVYDHFIPAVVDEIASRGEFYTAYTPYQAEASQGTLQAFYEYQTLICQLTGMEVSNASLYEGGTAVSEAVFMAMRVNGRHGKVVVAGSLHPEYRAVLETYLAETETRIVTVPCRDGVISPEDVARLVDDQTCAVVMQQPNFFGCIEDISAITEVAHTGGALAILSFDPFSPGLLKRPADYGVDVAVAEGQPLGTPLQYGGPLLGVFTCRNEYVRKMPGRLIGRTTDRNGKDCFVLNLQAREQHIRRDKATSNICTNQGLIALRATIFLSVIGKNGLIDAARLCHQKARYAASGLCSLDGVELCFQRPFFREFALRLPVAASDLIQDLAERGYNVGPELSRFDIPGVDAPERCLLVALTEKRTRQEIDDLVHAVGQCLEVRKAVQ